MKKKTRIGYLVVLGVLAFIFILSDNSRFQQYVLRPALCSSLRSQNFDVEVDSLRWHWASSRLELYGISCRDRQQSSVLSLHYLEADLKPLDLLWKQLHLTRLRLHALQVDLPALLATIGSENTSPGGSLRLKVDQVLLTHSSLQYEPSLDLRQISARLAFSLAQERKWLRIDDLHFELSNGFTLEDFALQASLDDEGLLEVPLFDLRLPQSYIQLDTLTCRLGDTTLHAVELLRPLNLKANIATADFPRLQADLQEAGLQSPAFQLDLLASGTMDNLKVDQLKVLDNLGVTSINLKGNLHQIQQQEQRQIEAQCSQVGVEAQELLQYVQALFPELELSLPQDLLQNLGYVSFSGLCRLKTTQLSLDGRLSTQPGDIDLNLCLDRQDRENYRCQADLDLPSYRFDRILDPEVFTGSGSLALQADALFSTSGLRQADVKSQVRRISLLDYDYRHLTLDVQVPSPSSCRINLDADDPNCLLSANAVIKNITAEKVYQATLEAVHLNLPALHLLSGDKAGAHLSFTMDTQLQGDTLERLWGYCRLDSIELSHRNTQYSLPSLVLNNRPQGDYAHLELRSEQINADAYGDFNIKHLLHDFQSNVLARYLPSLFTALPQDDARLHNQFSFQVDIASTDSLAKAFSLPLSVVDTATVKGYYYDEKHIFSLAAESGKLRVQNQLLENPRLNIDNKAGQRIDFSLQTNLPSKNHTFYLDMNAKSLADSLLMDARMEIDQHQPFASLQSRHRFLRNERKQVCIDNEVSIPYLLWKDARWQLDTALIAFHPEKLLVDGFHLYNQYGSSIQANGTISRQDCDSLFVKLHELDISYLTRIMKEPRPRAMHLGGYITADAALQFLMDDIQLDADATVRDFQLNEVVMGDLDADLAWNQEQSCLDAYALVKSGDLQIGRIDACYSPAEDSLRLDISSDGLPLDFVSHFTDRFLTLSAQAYGKVVVVGKPVKNKWYVLADAYAADGELYSPHTDTRYNFADSVKLTEHGLHFDHLVLYDNNRNTGVLDGSIYHTNFFDFSFDLGAELDRFQVLDLPASSQGDFYGNIVASGKIRVNGHEKDLHVDANIKTEDPSNLYLTLSESSDVNYGFITFVDKDAQGQAASEHSLPVSTKELPSNLSVDANLEVLPSANIVFVVNPASSDEMRMNGTGSLRISYDTKDDLQLFGRYELEKGKFGFTFQDLLHRDFNISQGSSINFSGDLMASTLDIKTSYSIPNVELSDILDESEISALNLNRTNIPVNCLLNISGDLKQPEISLGLAYPSADDELRRRISNVINTEEILNRQVVSLLLLNSFAVSENVQTYDATNNNMSAVMDLGLSTLSNQLNHFIYQAMGSDNLSFDLNYRYDDVEQGLGEWQVAMSGQMLNNRLTINGNIGSREDLVNDNTQFIGDFDLEYRFSRDGRLRGKFFNRTNDSRYFKSAMTTQGVGLVYKENFHNFPALYRQFVNWITRRISRSRAESDLKSSRR